MSNPPLFIDVITTERDNADAPPVRESRINYSNPVSRGWLEKHVTWALANGYAVHMAAITALRPVS